MSLFSPPCVMSVPQKQTTPQAITLDASHPPPYHSISSIKPLQPCFLPKSLLATIGKHQFHWYICFFFDTHFFFLFRIQNLPEHSAPASARLLCTTPAPSASSSSQREFSPISAVVKFAQQLPNGQTQHATKLISSYYKTFVYSLLSQQPAQIAFSNLSQHYIQHKLKKLLPKNSVYLDTWSANLFSC